MTRLSVFPPFYRAAALALALVSLQPGLAAIAQRAHAAPARSVAPAVHTQMRGALLALHHAAHIGDLGLHDGTLLPLRFASAAQQRRLRVGDRLVVTAAGPTRTRVPVHTLRVTGHTAEVRVRGVVIRVLEHGNVELLGAHGAAVTVHFSSTRGRPAVALGAELDIDVRIAPAGTLLARRVHLEMLDLDTTAVTGAGLAHLHALQNPEQDLISFLV